MIHREAPSMKVGKTLTEEQGNRTSLVLISNNAAQTFQIGKVLAEGLREGDCVALTGELGAGKTCLTQGIACGLGVSDRYTVTSPTFTLINEYPGQKAGLVHMDVYRITGSAELEEMGYDEYLRSGCVMVIEWAEKIQEVLPAEALYIRCSYIEENKRKIEISVEQQDRMIFLKQTLKEGGC
jgi:tRNA threonylcarbamoyladenosine biosynthesis protein TsaE